MTNGTSEPTGGTPDTPLPSIPWTAALETGTPAIDIEHQTLVALYNDLARAGAMRESG